MAAAALCGMDPLLFVRTEDDVELALLRKVAKAAIELSGKLRQDQADRTIGSLDKALKKGKSRAASTGSSSSSTRS